MNIKRWFYEQSARDLRVQLKELDMQREELLERIARMEGRARDLRK